MRSNAEASQSRRRPLPIRIASKSVRSTAVLERILGLDERFRGILSFTLPEALHLARQGYEDIFVGYPTADRKALAELAALAAERPDTHPALIVDEPAHLDLIESATGRGSVPIRVAIDIDPSWWPAQRTCRANRAEALADPHRPSTRAASRPRSPSGRGRGSSGAMAYEGHIAGVGDDIPGKPLRSAAIRTMQSRSLDELRERLPGVIAAIRDAADAELEWVNAGGTGSLARSKDLGIATELTSGSGFYAPALFDTYRSLDLTPAAFFCLPIVRRPHPGVATALGGGYIASGAPGSDRLPQPYMPRGTHARLGRGRGRGADAARRRGGEEAPRRRPRLYAPRQGGRAVRALRLALSDRGRLGRRTRFRPTGATGSPSCAR